MFNKIQINTIKKSSSFMNGNIDIDGDIIDIMVDYHGHKDFYESKWALASEIIYSDNFIESVERGNIPMLKLHSTDSHRWHNDLGEYHHVIIDGECYNVYFQEQ